MNRETKDLKNFEIEDNQLQNIAGGMDNVAIMKVLMKYGSISEAENVIGDIMTKNKVKMTRDLVELEKNHPEIYREIERYI